MRVGLKFIVRAFLFIFLLVGLLACDDIANSNIPDLAPFVEVSAGGNRSFAISSLGGSYAWGRNLSGSLGLGYSGDENSPTFLASLPVGVMFTQIAAGANHSIAISAAGKLYSWGNNEYGQLGLGDDGTDKSRNSPTLITSLPLGTTFKSVSAGEYHSVAISSDGKIYAWGLNADGQLGLGNTTSNNAPALISSATDIEFTQISSGRSHNLAIDSNGKLYSWGSNLFGQLGLGTDEINKNIPTEVILPNSDLVKQIASGSRFSLVLANNGKIYACGENTNSQLGLGDTISRNTPTSITLPVGVIFTQIAAGGEHSLSLTTDGKLYVWGANNYGQLGSGDNNDQNMPKVINTISDIKFAKIVAGANHSLAISQSSITYSWGYNYYGQLGLGNTMNHNSPTYVR